MNKIIKQSILSMLEKFGERDLKRVHNFVQHIYLKMDK